MKANQIEKLINAHLSEIQSYDPVDPPDVLARKAGIPTHKIIKLNGNENPYGASPKIINALNNITPHIYPDPLQRKIRTALQSYTGVESKHIIAGAGSDELIDLLFRLFITPGDNILDCEPTFAMYGFCARLAGAKTRMIPRTDLFDIDVPAIKRSIDTETKLIFLSSPNNPTGNTIPTSKVLALLETGLIVVIDEAYYEFCNQSVAHLVPKHENLVVLRTLSKWAGLAGLRIGYGIMSSKIVSHLMDIKSPYNVNVAAEAALLASLEDTEFLLKNVRLIIEERQRMFSLLETLPGVKPWPSFGNFILCQFENKIANKAYEGLAKQGIFVRKFGSKRLEDCFRVAVGTPDQTNVFIDALRELMHDYN